MKTFNDDATEIRYRAPLEEIARSMERLEMAFESDEDEKRDRLLSRVLYALSEFDEE